jgi:RNA polymerase sigma factor (sigma-70 family)
LRRSPVKNSWKEPIILVENQKNTPGLGLCFVRPEEGGQHMSKTGSETDVVAHEVSSLSEDMLWQRAVAFMSEKRRKQIVEKIARKFMIFSPYGIEDYLAEAKMVAFEAMKLSLEKGESSRMEGYFWTLLKNAFSRMSTNPSQADVVPGEDAGSMACIFDEYTEEWNGEEGTHPTSVSEKVTPLDKVMTRESLMSILLRKNLDKALESMTDREREVWAMVLDGRSSQEIAERLGSSRQNVEKLRDRGMDKVKRNRS